MPFTTINNHKIHYTDLPPTSGSSPVQTLIFIHGLGSTQNYFFPILPFLNTKHRCILFDNHRAGRSLVSATDDSSTSITHIAADVLSLLDDLHVAQPVVAIGYSMGGMVPTTLASTSPARIKAGVLIGPVHPTDAVAAIFDARIPLVLEQGMEVMANSIPNAATGPSSTPLQRAFIREMILAQTPEGYAENCRAIKFAHPPAYADVKCPILIVAGGKDKSAPLQGCQMIFGELGTKEDQKKLVVLEELGHWHCVEAPDEVGKVVAEFCDDLV
jgi:pimeloyl-ACP methyl ester carboxylesterase